MQRVLIPHQIAEAAATQRPRGNLSDLYPRWLGSRELILRHRDPYSAAITREIQDGYYGRPLDPARPGDPKDQQAFAYPIFVVFLLAPTVFAPFDIVRPAFTWILVFLTVLSVPFWIRILRWRIPWIDQLAAAILVLGSFQAVQGLKLQQLSLLVAAMIALVVYFVTSERLLCAGLVLAVGLIKPQLTLPLAAWLILWALSEWKTRWRFIAGFVVTLGLLLAGSTMILPGWLARFAGAIQKYRSYAASDGTMLEVLVGVVWGRILAVFVVAGCVIAMLWRRHAAPESPGFAWVTTLLLAATVVLVPMVAPYNQILLLPGALLLAKHWEQIQGMGGIARAALWAAAAALAWPWIATAFLSLLFLYSSTLAFRMSFLPLYGTLVIPILVMALLFVVSVEYGRNISETRRQSSQAG